MNTAITYRHNNSRRETAHRACEQSAPSEQSGGRGEEQMLAEFTQSLSEKERRLYALFRSHMSYREIAEITGSTEAAVRVRICRIKKQYEQRYF